MEASEPYLLYVALKESQYPIGTKIGGNSHGIAGELHLRFPRNELCTNNCYSTIKYLDNLTQR